MNVLVVDDQWVVLEGLKKKVDWKNLGLDEVFWAESAFEAKKIVQHEHIDILLTDIEMPIESGIELVAWFQENYPDTQCIFLTAHADFSYAQKAISYGGFDYILQPAKKEEIEGVIKRCIKELQKKLKIKKMAEKGVHYDEVHIKVLKILVNNMFEKDYLDDSLQAEWLQEINKKNTYNYFIPVLIKTDKDVQEIITRYLERIKAPTFYICTKGSKKERNTTYEVIICGQEKSTNSKENRDLLEKLYNRLARDKYKSSIYVGQASPEVLEQIKFIRKEKDNNVYLKEGIFYVKKKRITVSIREPKKEEWKQWMLSGDGILIKNQIKNLLDYAETEKYLTINYLKSIYDLFVDVWVICCYLKDINGKEWFDDSYPYEEFREAYTTIPKFNESVEFIISKFNKSINKEEDENSYIEIGERIKNVSQYIDENLEKNISRSTAAAMCCISDDYFSKLFKTEIGYGFKEYILLKKMEYCKQLLAETKYPIGVIAGKVGYDNFSNFTQLFKKYIGKTPQEYRTENNSKL